MIEQFEIKNQKGIGLIIFLYSIVPLVAAIFACCFWLSRPSLSRVPRCCITDQFSLGTSLFWGIFYLIFGSLMTIPFLFSDEVWNQTPILIFSFFFLPLPFIGLFMLLHRIKYRKYELLVDALLVVLVKKDSIVKSSFCFYYHDKQFSYDKIIPFMRDLQYSRILVFEENEVTINYCFSGVEGKNKVEYREKVWVCHSCGAKNEQRVVAGKSTCCEYCKTPCID